MYQGFNTETEEDASAAFAQNLADTVTRIKIIQGETFMGPMGKPHPNFTVQLIGSTVRTRSYRFHIFREYYQKVIQPSKFEIKAKFPQTVLYTNVSRFRCFRIFVVTHGSVRDRSPPRATTAHEVVAGHRDDR